MELGGVGFGEVANQECLLCEEGRVEDQRRENESDDDDLADRFGDVKQLTECVPTHSPPIVF